MCQGPSAARFPTTHWGRVLEAGDPEAPEARAALGSLCRDYWYPLYSFVRRKGTTPRQPRTWFKTSLQNSSSAATSADWTRREGGSARS
jgi:hypothetical protein